jgi:hypothetical protein
LSAFLIPSDVRGALSLQGPLEDRFEMMGNFRASTDRSLDVHQIAATRSGGMTQAVACGLFFYQQRSLHSTSAISPGGTKFQKASALQFRHWFPALTLILYSFKPFPSFRNASRLLQKHSNILPSPVRHLKIDRFIGPFPPSS